MRLGAVSAGFQHSNTPMLHHSIPNYGADGETCTPVGRVARQLTKLLLTLLIGKRMVPARPEKPYSGRNLFSSAVVMVFSR